MKKRKRRKKREKERRKRRKWKKHDYFFPTSRKQGKENRNCNIWGM
jgi:hypothetical protein